MLDKLTSSVSSADNPNCTVSPEEGDFSVGEKMQPSPIQREGSQKPSKGRSPEGDVSLSKLEEELLNVLIGRELYGLQIIEAFKAASDNRRKLSIGSLYPTLSRLEEKGLITSRMVDRPNDDKGGARRKFFKITRDGMKVLAEADRFRQRLTEWQPAT
jgi:PadR family transcriptional regulator, regulatory protein PadR